MTRWLYQVPYLHASRNTRCHITCFGAQEDKMSRFVSRKAKPKCDWTRPDLISNPDLTLFYATFRLAVGDPGSRLGQTKRISPPFPLPSSTQDPVVELFVRFAAYIFYPSVWRKFYTSEVCVLLVSYTTRGPFSVLCYAFLITSGKQAAILRSAPSTAIYSSTTLTD